MARKYVNPNRPLVADAWDRLAEQGRIVNRASELPRRPAAVVKAEDDLPQPQPSLPSKLNGYPWARSWPAFLAAISDPSDRSGARNTIRGLMESRPRNAFGERVPAEGGYLVPEYLAGQVEAYAMDEIVRPRATVYPMKTLRLPIPVLDNYSQASGNQVLGGLTFGVVEEGAAIPQTTPNFGRIVLEAWKIAALCTAPNELVNDAADAFGDFLARVIAKGLGWYRDDLFIYNGTGAGQAQALVNAPGQVKVTRNTSDEVLYADIVSMSKALHPQSRRSATWLVSASAFDQLLDLFYPAVVSAATTPITPSLLVMDGAPDGGPSLAGRPIIVNDHQPAVGTAGDIMLADLSLYLVGEREELTIERSQVGPGYLSDVSYFRVRSRFDGRFWPQSTFTTEAGQSVAPLVVLH